MMLTGTAILCCFKSNMALRGLKYQRMTLMHVDNVPGGCVWHSLMEWEAAQESVPPTSAGVSPVLLRSALSPPEQRAIQWSAPWGLRNHTKSGQVCIWLWDTSGKPGGGDLYGRECLALFPPPPPYPPRHLYGHFPSMGAGILDVALNHFIFHCALVPSSH